MCTRWARRVLQRMLAWNVVCSAWLAYRIPAAVLEAEEVVRILDRVSYAPIDLMLPYLAAPAVVGCNCLVVEARSSGSSEAAGYCSSVVEEV